MNGNTWLKDSSSGIKKHQYKGKRQSQETLDFEYDHLQHDDASEWLLFEIDRNIYSRFSRR